MITFMTIGLLMLILQRPNFSFSYHLTLETDYKYVSSNSSLDSRQLS